MIDPRLARLETGPLRARSEETRHHPLRRGLSALGLLAALTALGLGTASAGCGGGGKHHARSAEQGDDDDDAPATKHRARGDDTQGDDAADIVHFEQDLDEDAPGLLAEFEKRAQRYGCETAIKEDNVVARCPDGPIVMVKQGLHVTVGCKGISLGECKQLFKHIVDDKGEQGGGVERQ